MRTNTISTTDRYQSLQSRLNPSNKDRLIAKWVVEDGRLTCKWISN